MSYETIRLDRDGHVATLTLDRPERLNAFNDTMVQELVAACDEIDGDDEIRAVVVTGAGRAFCAGADLGRATKPSMPTPVRSPTVTEPTAGPTASDVTAAAL